MQVTVTLLLL